MRRPALLCFGPELEFVDVLMTTLLVGTSADYAVHVCLHRTNAALTAVSLAALTTGVANAGLLLAPMRPLQKSAVYMLCSTAFSYACALACHAWHAASDADYDAVAALREATYGQTGL